MFVTLLPLFNLLLRVCFHFWSIKQWIVCLDFQEEINNLIRFTLNNNTKHLTGKCSSWELDDTWQWNYVWNSLVFIFHDIVLVLRHSTKLTLARKLQCVNTRMQYQLVLQWLLLKLSITVLLVLILYSIAEELEFGSKVTAYQNIFHALLVLEDMLRENPRSETGMLCQIIKYSMLP